MYEFDHGTVTAIIYFKVVWPGFTSFCFNSSDYGYYFICYNWFIFIYTTVTPGDTVDIIILMPDICQPV